MITPLALFGDRWLWSEPIVVKRNLGLRFVFGCIGEEAEDFDVRNWLVGLGARDFDSVGVVACASN